MVSLLMVLIRRTIRRPPLLIVSPERLAADELALTNSVVTFVRHASTGRVAFSRVSGSIYFDLKSPDLQQVLEKIASSHDIAATLDSFNPQQPQYKELKAALARARKTGDANVAIPRAHTKTEAVRAKLLARELMPSLPIWNAGVGCREIWVLPM